MSTSKRSASVFFGTLFYFFKEFFFYFKIVTENLENTEKNKEGNINPT